MIKLENISKDFKSYKKEPGLLGAFKSLFSRETIIKKAVNDISFEIDEGEIVGYIGANGAGKSTTIKMMTGILVPTSGRCIVNGIEPYKDRKNNAKNIGVVFGQRTQLWWDLPLTETFSILKEIYEVSDEDFKCRLEFLDNVLSLNEFMSSSVRTLSLGQRMRADLAAALIHNPKILYLDEPTIGLDVVVKEKMREAIKLINTQFNTTVILTTHDLNDIEELCNRIIIIDRGEKIYDGSLKDIKDKYGYMRTVELSIKDIDKVQSLNLNDEFNISKDNLKTKIEDNNLLITFNKNSINIKDIVSYIMPLAQVIDMKIKETAIEDIIKKIYSKEVSI